MSKGGKQTSTQKTELPAYVTQAQQNLINSGQELAAPFLQTPQYAVAGFNTDQLKGFDLARQMAQDAFTGNPVRGVPGEAALSWPTALAGPASLAGVSNASAAQVGQGDIQAAMNPYIGSVVNGVVDQIGRNYRDQDAQIGAQAASQQAFGGSGEALRRSRLASDTQKTMTDTVSQLLSAGFDRATATAMANAQMRQQTELTNAGAANNASQFNASAQNANRQFDASATNATNQFNASQKNSFDLAAPQLEAALASGNQQLQMNALQQLLGIGSTQQQLAQGAIDVPFTALQRLAGTVPSQTESTTTTTQPKQGGGVLGTLLGTGLSILGMPMTGGGSIAGSLFSDRREKTDIKKLGRDPQTGEMLYAYRYKDDPKSYPKVVGPMAQDIEKSEPGRVREVGGKKIVRA